jgi:two-component system phosphate regulon sensor histidine kinase PhoR
MKKRTLYGIIFLMSLSLAGIIVVQWFWIKNAIEVKEENYNQNIRESMETAAHRLDKKVNFVFLSHKLHNRFSEKPDIKEPKIKSIEEEKIKSGYEKQLDEARKKLEEQRKVFHKKVEVNMNQTDSLEERALIGLEKVSALDSLPRVVLRNLPMDSIINISLKKADESLKKIDWETFNVQVERQAEKFDAMFKEMAFEYKFRFDSLQDRISYKQIDSLLHFEFKERGIHTDYAYAVYDSEMDSLLYKAHDFEPGMIENAFQVNLFPSDLVRKSVYLLVSIPGKKEMIIRSIVWLLVASVFFTLIILATFGVTIHTILRQKKLSEIKSDFINNMTHEFKTPIATISLAADSIANPKTLASIDHILNFLRIIKSENKRMNNQVERVLQMSLLDKRDFQIDMQPENVHPLIDQVVYNTRLQLDKNGGTITYDPEAGDDLIQIDREHFLNILYNLVDNAVKYSDGSPEITITTRNIKRQFIISVEDKGIGIPREDQKRVFDKFFRVSTGNVHNVKGFGLGLSYVREIVKQMNGEISLVSQQKKGTRFDVTFPLTEDYHGKR